MAFCQLYHYLEYPDEIHNVNAALFKKLSQTFNFIDDILLYYKSVNSRGELGLLLPLVVVIFMIKLSGATGS